MPEIGRIGWPYILEWQAANDLSYTTVLLICALTLHNGAHLGANLVYWVFYHYEFPIIERYKSNDKLWPWYEDPERWQVLVRKSVAVLLFNANVVPVTAILLLDYFQLLDKHSMAIEDLPDASTLALTITLFMVIDDFLFYFLHRLLHWRMIYPYIHKMHHTH